MDSNSEEMIIYTTADGKVNISLLAKDGSVWLSQNQLAELSGSCIEELPEKVFDLVGEFIRRHRSWFGAIGNFASHIARMTDQQHDQVKNHSGNVVTVLAEVMHSSMPQWSIAEARFKAQNLLWLIDGYIRSEFAGVNELPPPEELINFFRRGAGIAEK
jgi:hypothetical protein